jgi:hypothetical protein
MLTWQRPAYENEEKPIQVRYPGKEAPRYWQKQDIGTSYTALLEFSMEMIFFLMTSMACSFSVYIG